MPSLISDQCRLQRKKPLIFVLFYICIKKTIPTFFEVVVVSRYKQLMFNNFDRIFYKLLQ